MTPSSTLPDPTTDPGGYVLATAAAMEEEASRVSLGTSDCCFHTPEDDAWLVDFYLAQAALLRRLGRAWGHLGFATQSFALAAARAYAEGTA